MKSRGRRFETGGFAIWAGGWLYVVSPLAGLLAGLAFVLLGVGLQLKAERKHKQREYPTESSLNFENLPAEQWKLFRGELEELVKHYRRYETEAGE